MKSDPGSECSLSRRWLLKAGATIGGSSALAGRFAFLKFASANMLNGAEGSAGTKMQSKIHVYTQKETHDWTGHSSRQRGD